MGSISDGMAEYAAHCGKCGRELRFPVWRHDWDCIPHPWGGRVWECPCGHVNGMNKALSEIHQSAHRLAVAARDFCHYLEQTIVRKDYGKTRDPRQS